MFNASDYALTSWKHQHRGVQCYFFGNS